MREALLAREPGDDGAQPRDVGARLLNVAADAGADLDLRLDHLGLDLLAEQHLALFEHLRDVRAQLARLRVDDLKLLLDAECVMFWRHHPEVLLPWAEGCFAQPGEPGALSAP